jgi:hypothetical protein
MPTLGVNNMPNDKDEFFYFTIIDVKDAVEQWGDEFFSELEKAYPEIYDKLEAYIANKQITEFLTSQEEVL